jgi:glucosamine--fructose-6-phosphate aminotransferase (isomerizing)
MTAIRCIGEARQGRVEKGVAGACSVLGSGRYKSNTPPLFLCSHTCLLPLAPIPSPVHQLTPTALQSLSFIFRTLTFVSSPCGKSPPPHHGKLSKLRGAQADDCVYSGIFGYINYLVEKDRKYILDTLINGKLSSNPFPRRAFHGIGSGLVGLNGDH